MKHATFRDLMIQGLDNGESGFLSLGFNLTRAVIQRNLTIENLHLNEIHAKFLQVGGTSNLKNIIIGGKVDFSYSNFSSFLICNIHFNTEKNGNQPRGILHLDGMTYQNINATKGDGCSEEWSELSNLQEKLNYSTSIYAHLESFFRRQGNPQAADQVFFAQKKHELQAVHTGYTKWLYIAWEWISGYGRDPLSTFVWSIIVIAFGCVVFWRDMVMRDDKLANHHYNPLWYSLDLFLPIVDLQTADSWLPHKNRWIARHYVRIHRILGYILIPIGFAALTGIIK